MAAEIVYTIAAIDTVASSIDRAAAYLLGAALRADGLAVFQATSVLNKRAGPDLLGALDEFQPHVDLACKTPKLQRFVLGRLKRIQVM